MNNKFFANIEMVGETLVILAAAMWITHIEFIPYVYAVGAIFTFVGKCVPNQKHDTMALERLFSLRKLGSIFLLISAGLMFLKGTTYVGYNVYLFKSSWLMFFVMFCVVEIYTSIRILLLTRKNNKKS